MIDKEIEITFLLEDESQKKQFKTYVEMHGKFIGTITQTDYYLIGPETKPEFNEKFGYKDSLNTLRIRQTDDGNWLTFKLRHIDPNTGKTLSRDEYETKVEDAKTLLKILEKLNYKAEQPLIKTRTIYLIENDTLEITFNEFKSRNVGPFTEVIEIEVKQQVQTLQDGERKMYQLLQKAGIEKIKAFDRSFTHMIWNPGHDFSETKTVSEELKR